ncbi:MAG: hypothetical protein BVN31_07400 [Proteobacteria bacterium ST_bin15]|nr:MAG: hypothetical protein BVN31_07400 [Proteobacteria bacterium ST_bin15]
MLKSYNRQSGRLTYVEIIHDDLLGELVVTSVLPTRRKRAPQIVRDVDLGELLIAAPDTPGNPRRSHAPPRCRSAKTAGSR